MRWPVCVNMPRQKNWDYFYTYEIHYFPFLNITTKISNLQCCPYFTMSPIKSSRENEIICQESHLCVCVCKRERKRESIWQLQGHLRKWNCWCFISFVIKVSSKACICAVCNEQYANPYSVCRHSARWLEWKQLLSSNKMRFRFNRPRPEMWIRYNNELITINKRCFTVASWYICW